MLLSLLILKIRFVLILQVLSSYISTKVKNLKCLKIFKHSEIFQPHFIDKENKYIFMIHFILYSWGKSFIASEKYSSLCSFIALSRTNDVSAINTFLIKSPNRIRLAKKGSFYRLKLATCRQWFSFFFFLKWRLYHLLLS